MCEQDEKVFGVDDYDDYWRERVRVGRTECSRGHRFMVDLVGQYVPRAGAVLDCGVGPGHIFRGLSSDYRMSGVEISSEAIARYDWDTSSIKQADLNDGLPDFGGSFDCIIVSMILHHLQSVPDFLKEMKAALKDRGVCVVQHPNVAYYNDRLRYLFGKFPNLHIHFAHVTPTSSGLSGVERPTRRQYGVASVAATPSSMR